MNQSYSLIKTHSAALEKFILDKCVKNITLFLKVMVLVGIVTRETRFCGASSHMAKLKEEIKRITIMLKV